MKFSWILCQMLLMAAGTLLYSQSSFPDPKIIKTEILQGDLILTGGQVMTIENTHLKVFGKISVLDSSQLHLRQCFIEVESSENVGAVAGGTIDVLDRGVLVADTTLFGAVALGGVDPSQAEALKSGNLIGANQAKITLNNCFSQTQSFFGQAKVVMRHSFLIQEPLGIIHVEQQVDVTLEDCEIGAILLDLAEVEDVEIDSLVPGYHEFWSARMAISENLPYNLIMRRCTLNDNDAGFQGGMEMGWNLAFNALTSRANISNSKVNKIIFSFPPDEPAVIDGFKLREPIDVRLNQVDITNTEVQTQWGIFMEGGPATITNSEGLFIFMLGGTAPVEVINSEIFEIDPRKYSGTLTLKNSIFGGGYEVFDSSHLFMEGSMRTIRPLPFFDASSKITRLHQVTLLFDENGAPFAPFPLRVMRDSQQVWSGIPDLMGSFEFEITYGLDNYQDEWVIESLDPAIVLNKLIGLHSSNPIVINLAIMDQDTVFRSVIHVARNYLGYPDGSRSRPYRDIQEAIDNAAGDVITVEPGTYPGFTAPGASRGGLALKDDLILRGAGAEQTIIQGGIGGEDFDNSAVIGFRVEDGFHLRNAQLTVRNCLVTNAMDHAFVGVNCNLKIYNNTFSANVGDAMFLINSISADIRNNIFAHNAGFGLEPTPPVNIRSDYNDIWSNGDDYVHIDLKGPHDISVDPLFVDTLLSDYRLQLGSPAVDAGDPNEIFNDVDGSRNDMGAFGGPYGKDFTTATKEIHSSKASGLELEVRPNPFANQTLIEYSTPSSGYLNLTLYDQTGRYMVQIFDRYIAKGRHSQLWSGVDLDKGIYLLQLKSNFGTVTKKIALL